METSPNFSSRRGGRVAGGFGLEKPCSAPQGSFKHLETNEDLRFSGATIGTVVKL